MYFDLTDILEHARHHDTISGISRASLRIVGHLLAGHGSAAVKLIAWHPIKGSAFELDSDWCTADYDYDQRDFCRSFDLDRHVRTIKTWADTWYAGRPFRRRYHRLRAHVFAALKNDHFFRIRKIDLPRTIGSRLLPIDLKPGDVIVIMGATWGFEPYWRFLQRQTMAGVSVFLFVHDLIPLIVPEHVGDAVPDDFRKWLDAMSRVAAGFLTNSQSTKRDLQIYLAQRGAPQPIEVVPLAHQFLTSDRPGARRLRARVLSDARLPYVLFVGTLESRKNLWGLARVWGRLIKELGFKAPRLVLAGKSGWLKDDFDDLMRGTGSLEGNVRIIESPTEHELSYLYSNCLFTVFPSYYEGWGLPIGESLWFGKTCVTSKTSSMPEVGLDMCSYVDPHDLDDVYQAIKKMVVDVAHRSEFERRITRDRLRTWTDVAEDLWSVLTPPSPGGIQSVRIRDLSARV